MSQSFTRWFSHPSNPLCHLSLGPCYFYHISLDLKWPEWKTGTKNKTKNLPHGIWDNSQHETAKAFREWCGLFCLLQLTQDPTRHMSLWFPLVCTQVVLLQVVSAVWGGVLGHQHWLMPGSRALTKPAKLERCSLTAAAQMFACQGAQIASGSLTPLFWAWP